ncbi:hypothetical protein FACS189473_1850 [Spirochaetia bacterium]|nr:hypothetical protein FACS189473_1850 [Spirochaetia bacterium]
MLVLGMAIIGCDDPNGSGDTRAELSAGNAVNAAYTATTASVTFTGAAGLSLAAADFTVTTGGTIGTPAVSGDTVTVPVILAANTGTSAKTYTVGINGGSAKIKGSATVVITQAANDPGDTRAELSAGSAVNAAYTATTASVTFTGAAGLTLAATDFTVTTGGVIGTSAVSGDTVTVPVTFAANTGTSAKTYTVGINGGSAKIKGSATVVITQAAAPTLDTRAELTAGSAVNAAYTATTASVTFTEAAGLSLAAADFTVTTGGTIGTPAVSGDTVTVPVTFAANPGTSAKTYTVGINGASAKIKGSATVVITQAAAPTLDTRVELTAGSAVRAAYTATTASVTFTGAAGLTLTAADFTVSAGGTISNPAVSGNTVTVPVTFAANAGTSAKTYTVGINGASAKIKGGATVKITQTTPPDTGTDIGLYIGTAATPEANTGTLAQALAWLKANAADNTDYTILIGANESLPSWTLGGAFSGASVAANGKTGVKITLRDKGAERTVQLSASGSLFSVDSGVTLVLDENITLVGRSGNNATLVQVYGGGSLEMRENAKITGNTSSSYSGGVYVNGTFTMNGSASVSSNTSSSYSGGVSVGSRGTFTMNGSASVSGNTSFYSGGGGSRDSIT